MGKTNPGKTPKRTGKARKDGGAFQLSKEPVRGKVDIDVHKYEATRGEQEPAPGPAQEAPAYEQLGELPRSYGGTTLYLIARDPHWLFSYWDIDWSAFPVSDMKDGQNRIYLKLFSGEGSEEFTTEINPEAKNWYLPVSKASVAYFAELGYYDKSGDWKQIAKSDMATAPSDSLSQEEQATFATVPFHLTFQRLLEMVRTSMHQGETLIQALSRLQHEGRKLAFGPGTVPGWTDEQRQLLAALFGNELVERIGMGSAEIDQLLRKELLEKLQSESASEIMSKAQLAGLAAPGESSLFSGFAAAQGLWGPEVMSLFSAIGASWSAQPFSEQKGREFFMHVNAEVIFYGGTHPDAKVWIDGKEIKLNPDGTFRFHFRFPDGNYEIPIVAQSPDGVEERSASLTFERATARKGDVGATAQPAELGTPMGQTA